ncbi:MAG: peptidoglycan DD-metalloendopeptidase family protein [Betaproteobacteria bacterium]|nr:peptidoglycan DD-metalloendopeptidase family protein [Betaproteobacteria bacterium]
MLPGAALGDTRADERDLLELRARIETLGKRLDRKEAGRREARDALREAERAISASRRTLVRLDGEARAAREDAKRLAARRRELERQIVEREAALGRTLALRHSAGASDALRVLLSGRDPSVLARNLHYLGYVSRAWARAIAEYRAALVDLAQLRERASARAAQIASIEAAQRADRDKLIAQRRERRHVLDRLAAEIRRARSEIGNLRADEARLARLVQGIGQVLGESPSDGSAGRGRLAAVAKFRFANLRGALQWPVRGELTDRFGAPTRTRGVSAKGIFIRAAEGEPVRAVAAGQVVFADWMRGFGNILIVDHGETYMSIYANNESLLKLVGEPVAGGDPIATVGASGGGEQSGLYFELRHLGKAFDPSRWIGSGR